MDDRYFLVKCGLYVSEQEVVCWTELNLLQTEDVGVVCVDHLDHSVKVTGAVSVHPAVNVVGGDLNTLHVSLLLLWTVLSCRDTKH